MPRAPAAAVRAGPEQHSHPEEEADGEQDLPEASQVKVLEALVAEPGPKIAEDPQDTCPQPHRDTHQQKGSLVASGEYAREKLRGDKREHKEDRHHRERSGKEGYGIPASANPPPPHPGEEVAKASSHMEVAGQEYARYGRACDPRQHGDSARYADRDDQKHAAP